MLEGKRYARTHLYIFDHREVAVLSLLILSISFFTFTLGVHYAKHITNYSPENSNTLTSAVITSPDQVPNRSELIEQSKGADQALEEALHQTLHDEVTRAGIKLETPHEIDLPVATKNAQGGATSPNPMNGVRNLAKGSDSLDDAQLTTNAKYTLQIGSYSSPEEAKKHLEYFQQRGLQATLFEAALDGKGQWFRIYLGKFPTRFLAEQTGNRYRTEKKVESFVITPLKTQ